MLGLMGFSGSLPLYVIHRYYIFVFIDRANKDACLLACVNCILRNLVSKYINLLMRALNFIVYVRLIVEYCTLVWSPSLKKDIESD